MKNKNLIEYWDEEEKQELKKTIESSLHLYSIYDIRVVGSYVFGGDLKDIDVIVIVDDDIDDFKIIERSKDYVIDIRIHNKDKNEYRIFNGRKLGKFNLPQYSLYSNKIIGGKQEDINRWKEHKKGKFVEIRENRIWNGKIPNSENIKIVSVEGGVGVVIQ